MFLKPQERSTVTHIILFSPPPILTSPTVSQLHTIRLPADPGPRARVQLFERGQQWSRWWPSRTWRGRPGGSTPIPAWRQRMSIIRDGGCGLWGLGLCAMPRWAAPGAEQALSNHSLCLPRIQLLLSALSQSGWFYCPRGSKEANLACSSLRTLAEDVP